MSISNLQYEACEAIIRKHSATFYAAFRNLPEAKRNAVFAIYAFCRSVDDAVDESDSGFSVGMFEAFLTSFPSELEGEPFFFPLARKAILDYGIPLEAIQAQIDGQLSDASFRQPEGLEDLLDYCYKVASSVGLMLLPILATENHRNLQQSAIELGYAMQLTNILRDVGEDADRGRIYLPRKWMNPHILAAIQAKVPNPEFIGLWERLALQAEGYYDRCLTDLPLYDKDARLPLALSMVLYRGILDAVRASGYTCLSERCYVKDPEPYVREVKRRLLEI